MKNKTGAILLIVFIMAFGKGSIAQKTIICLTENIKETTSFDTARFYSSAALADDFYLWDNGKTIYVNFLNGSPALQQRIKTIAKKWEQFANIHFNFIQKGDSHIRIELTNNGYIKTAIGNRALIFPYNEANMQIDTTTFENSQVLENVVLHSFGHVLGLQDEIHVPEKGILWNNSRLENYFLQTNWKEKEQAIFIEKYQINRLSCLKYDEQSVMTTPLPKAFVANSTSLQWNKNISMGNRKIIAALYPKKETNNVTGTKPVIKFYDLKIVKSNSKNGISFFPVFDFNNPSYLNTFFISIVLVDKYNNPIKTTQQEYSLNNQIGVYSQPYIPSCNIKGINQNGLTDIELFIPSFILQNIKKEDGIFAVFKVFYRNPKEDTSEWIYISKPYEIK